MEDSMLSEVRDAPPVVVSLGRACTEVVSEYRGGRWPQIATFSGSELRAFLLNELLTRCPGFSTREYRLALTKRLVVRRWARKPAAERF